MGYRSIAFGVAFGLSASSALARPAAAEAAAEQVAPGFFPFVGCWQSDSANTTATDAITCIAPAANSADVEILSFADGHVASRRVVDVTGAPRAVDEQGCHGQEHAAFSSPVRRVYLRGSFTCEPNGISGERTTLLSVVPSGEMLRIEGIRSGSGVITRVNRMRPIGVPAGLPREVVSRIEASRLAVLAARAQAAAPLEPSDVIDAVKQSDPTVAREWLLATAQRFQLSGDEMNTLIRAKVPAPVLQAMMAVPPAFQLGMTPDSNGRSANEYLNTPGIAPTFVDAPVVYENVYVGQPLSGVYGAPGTQGVQGVTTTTYSPNGSMTTSYEPGGVVLTTYPVYGYGAPYYYSYPYPVTRRYSSPSSRGTPPRREASPVGVRPGQTPRPASPSTPARPHR